MSHAFKNGLVITEPLDKEVITSVTMLNSLNGVRTSMSYSGHGYSSGRIMFYCDNYLILKQIIEAIVNMNYGYETILSTYFKNKIHKLHLKRRLWMIEFDAISEGGFIISKEYAQHDYFDIVWSIYMQPAKNPRRVNTTRAWHNLENALIKVTNKK